MSGIHEIERGNCSGAKSRPDGTIYGHELQDRNTKFVVVHQDGSTSESPWFFMWKDGTYIAAAKRADASNIEWQYMTADVPVRIVK